LSAGIGGVIDEAQISSHLGAVRGKIGIIDKFYKIKIRKGAIL